MICIQLFGSFVKVAVIQLNIVQGDIEHNLSNAIKRIIDAAHNGAELICLPEAFATGINFMQLHNVAEYPKDSKVLRTIVDLARKFHVSIVFGLIEKDENGEIFDSVFVVNDEGIIDGTYRRRILWYGEANFISRGSLNYPYINTKFGKVGIIVGYELFFPEACRRYYEEEVDLIICVANIFNKLSDKARALLRARAIENQCYFIFASSIGIHTLVNDIYMGKSGIYCDQSLLPNRLASYKEGDVFIINETQNREIILYGKLYLKSIRDSGDRYFSKDFKASLENIRD